MGVGVMTVYINILILPPQNFTLYFKYVNIYMNVLINDKTLIINI